MEILNIYRYGSKVYKTHSSGDEDYIYINNQINYYDQICDNEKDITIYGIQDFKEAINNHEIYALECLFLSKENILKETIKFDFKLDLCKLRTSISKTSSNSFVKAKKKIEKEKEFYIGKKSLFHSLRILMFGIQIVKYGKIIDYSEANYYWDKIMNIQNNEWQYYFKEFKPIYNSLCTEFRKLAPKK